jgi:hypothetical protein
VELCGEIIEEEFKEASEFELKDFPKRGNGEDTQPVCDRAGKSQKASCGGGI